MEQMCLRSFLAIGYDAHLYVYGPVEGIPAGVQVMDASEILSPDQIFRQGPGYGEGSYATFSDRFRYYLLLKMGGWWFDLDFEALRLKPEPADLLLASEWDSKLGQYPVGCAIWCKPGDQRIVWLRDQCDYRLTNDPHLPFGSIGPHLLRELVTRESLQANVAPWWEFCPYSYYRINRMAYRTNEEWLRDKLRLARELYWQMTKPDIRANYIRRGTRAIHWYNESWRGWMDKDTIYHWRSPYGRMQRRYLK
jgi:hypothetical protein